MMMNARRGLFRQINRRLLLALALATVFSALVGGWVYRESNRRAHDSQVGTLRTHLQGALAQVERQWGREAYNYRARLEYTRILEDPLGRAARLSGYLTAQGGSPVFPYMRVLGTDHRTVLASYAYGLDNLPEVAFSPGSDSLWHWDAARQALYRVFRQTIWLGDGNGELQLFRPIDHALLHALDMPGSNIVLYWDGTAVASSQGNDGLSGVAGVLATHGDDPRHWLVWNDASADEAKPRLFVLPAVMRAFAPADLAVPLALATLVFALAAWATLGRWSVLSLRRVQALRQAQEQFAEDRALDPAIEAALARASGNIDDEIADVADTLRMMMQTIVSAEAAESEARASLLLSDLVVRNASEGIIVTDAENRIIATNPAFERITGYAAAEALGENPRLLKSGLQDTAFYQRMWRALLDTGCWSGELWNRRKNGELYAQRASIVAVPEGAHGGMARYMALFADVTVEKQQEEALAYQAGHDPLTGLPNRRLLGDRMESALARARRDGSRVGVLLLDLDGFKHINDTLGHLMGDKVLIEVARRIQHTLRETDTLARIGGDEFMIVVEGLAEQGDLQQVATKVLEHVQQPMPIDHTELFVTTSIGITLFPDDGQGIGELFANADTALYRAKAEGRNVFRFFTAQMHAAAVARMAIETELRRAIPNNEFELHYQPVVELASGKLVKAEALVRWRHPERGLVSPNDFIPVAEDTGMILPLGAWIVGEAARQAAAWDAASPDDFKICVNFSAYQFRRSDPLALLAESLAASGIGSGHLAIEITESLFMEDEGGSLDQLHLLRAEGFEIAIDDFGTGYSSLSYLQRLPIDTLKIDRSFIQGIPADPKSMALIDAMLSLGTAFGIAVIAEGVETATQADFLRERGCRYGQGYYFGKPVPAAEFARVRFDGVAA